MIDCRISWQKQNVFDLTVQIWDSLDGACDRSRTTSGRMFFGQWTKYLIREDFESITARFHVACRWLRTLSPHFSCSSRQQKKKEALLRCLIANLNQRSGHFLTVGPGLLRKPNRQPAQRSLSWTSPKAGQKPHKPESSWHVVKVW